MPLHQRTAAEVEGVNIHEHNPATGHYMTEELMRKDFELMKQHNRIRFACAIIRKIAVSTNCATNTDFMYTMKQTSRAMACTMILLKAVRWETIRNG